MQEPRLLESEIIYLNLKYNNLEQQKLRKITLNAIISNIRTSIK